MVGEFTALMLQRLFVFVVFGDVACDAITKVCDVLSEVSNSGIEFRFGAHKVAENIHKDLEVLGAGEGQLVHIVSKELTAQFIVGVEHNRAAVFLEIIDVNFTADVFFR